MSGTKKLATQDLFAGWYEPFGSLMTLQSISVWSAWLKNVSSWTICDRPSWQTHLEGRCRGFFVWNITNNLETHIIQDIVHIFNHLLMNSQSQSPKAIIFVILWSGGSSFSTWDPKRKVILCHKSIDYFCWNLTMTYSWAAPWHAEAAHMASPYDLLHSLPHRVSTSLILWSVSVWKRRNWDLPKVWKHPFG